LNPYKLFKTSAIQFSKTGFSACRPEATSKESIQNNPTLSNSFFIFLRFFFAARSFDLTLTLRRSGVNL
jgi:hypothetical protein